MCLGICVCAYVPQRNAAVCFSLQVWYISNKEQPLEEFVCVCVCVFVYAVEAIGN